MTAILHHSVSPGRVSFGSLRLTRKGKIVVNTAKALLAIIMIAMIALLLRVNLADSVCTSTQTIVVQPGDTPYSIVRANVRGDGDWRDAVAQMNARRKPGPLKPGEQVTVPQSCVRPQVW